MHLIHLTSSTFFGGPERQMLGLGQALPTKLQSSYMSFLEGGRCAAFLKRTAEAGFRSVALANDTPNLRAAIRELTTLLRDESREASVLFTHGYKANMLGRIAARRCEMPVVAVSRGWTGENLKVRCYEALDRVHLRFIDAVVCVSEGQARKVRRIGISVKKIEVIRNAARLEAFRDPDPTYRERMREVASAKEGDLILVAAGRLSPEKGFDVLVEAAALVGKQHPQTRFVLFGEGVQRPQLERRIAELGLCERFVLPGFRDDLDKWLPWADLVVLPSFTEGLPNVALEASAAGVPIVATAVGGTPEVVCDGLNGLLVPSGKPGALADRILHLCSDRQRMKQMGNAGRRLMHERFSFQAQADAYQRLVARLLTQRGLKLARAA